LRAPHAVEGSQDDKRNGFLSLSQEGAEAYKKGDIPMGDKKSKKDKAKGQKQKDAKQAKTAKEKQDRHQPRV
jgi:hypothetical protein